MKYLVSLLIAGLIVGWLVVSSPALAADSIKGANIFRANCAACHLGGGNLVNGAKTLKQADLEKYQMASLEALKTQVTNGKGAMPAFKTRLTEGQIEDVATYVLEQAQKGWL